MSNNGDEPKLQITCDGCGQRFSTKAPAGEIYNGLRVSAYTASHERLVKCPNAKCARLFLLMIQQVQSAWGYMPVVDPEIIAQMEGSRIVQPKGLIVH